MKSLVFPALAYVGRADLIGQEVFAQAATLCANEPLLQGYSGQDQVLVDTVVGDNVIEAMLTDQSCALDAACLKKYQTSGINSGVKAGAGLALAIVTLVLYVLLLPCACCRCWRRCPIFCCLSERRRPGNFSSCTRGILTSFFLLFIGAVIICIVYATEYRTEFVNGTQGMYCETFRFLNNTLNGYPGDATGQGRYVGLVEAVNVLEGFVGLLATGSPFLTQIYEIVEGTAPIQYAIADLSANLNVFNAMVGANTSQNIGPYQCYFCNACCGGPTSQIGQINTAISTSVAAALNVARGEVAGILSGSTLAGLQGGMAAIVSPVSGLENKIETFIGGTFVNTLPAVENVFKYVYLIALIIILVVIAPTLLLVTSVVYGLWRSDRPTYADPAIAPQNPCHVSCSWCLSFLYAFIVFLLAGIVLLLGYIEGSACQIMMNLGPISEEIAFRFGTGTTAELYLGMIETCLLPTSNGDLLDAFKVGNETARDMFDVAPLIASKFSVITEALGSTSGQNLSTNPSFISLVNSIGGFGNLYMIPPSQYQSYMSNTNGFNSTSEFLTLGQAEYTRLYSLGIGGVPECANRTINLTMSGPLYSAVQAAHLPIDANNQTVISGIQSYMDRLTADGVNTGANAQCSALSGATISSRMNPWGNLLSLTQAVVNHTFECDTVNVFQNPDGTPNITNVARVCNWTEWQQYISNFSSILMAKATAVDVATATTMATITGDLQSLLQSSLLMPLENLLNGFNCQFMYTRFNALTDAMCYSQTPGIIGLSASWIGFGVITLFCILIEFIIWRHLKDNRCLWYDVCQGKIPSSSGKVATGATTTVVTVGGGGQVVVVSH